MKNKTSPKVTSPMKKKPSSTTAEKTNGSARSRHQKELVRADNISHQQQVVTVRIMPCQHTCEVKRLNLVLKEVKLDKLKTLRNIYEVTDQIRRDYPHKREEMTRNKLMIERNIVAGVAELMTIDEEIARGCMTCRES